MWMNLKLQKLLISIYELDQNLTEFDGQVTDPILIERVNEALIDFIEVNSWEEVSNFIFDLKKEFKWKN